MRSIRFRPLARTTVALAAAAALSLVPAGSASAHGDKERAEKMRAEYSAGTNIPLISSPNVNLVATQPGSTGISGCFMKSAPIFVMSNLDSVRVFDVSNPLAPEQVGVLPNLVFENEAINCGERKTADGTERFALIGVDLYDVSTDIQHTSSSALGKELIVVDVTDPANPFLRSSAPATTSTHTVACIAETDCRYAYSAGSGSAGTFSILDLTDLDNPVEVDADPGTAGVQPFESPAAGHKWNFDDAGYGTHTGYDGSAIFDVSNPTEPQLVAGTGMAADVVDPDGEGGYNDFIHHNSFRPNASAFRPDAPPALANGNILLVTEEDYEQTDCTKAGSFQTWHVKRLDGSEGSIVPLDKVELADLGSFPVPQYAFCSSHWFDYHQSGIVAVGFYGGGTQFVDVRDPREIKPYGHATWGVSEVWDSYWMPVYNRNGVATGKKTNLAYSVDLVRGLDVYAVDLPGGTELTGAVALGSTNPFGVFSWPEDALPLTVVGLGLLGVVMLRRRAARVPARVPGDPRPRR
ncbi:MAG TPA: hypothetical protein VFZ64_01865 [Nocardioidaceae bacterium]